MREKTNKYIKYSFNLLIMYGSSYMIRHYIAILRERVMSSDVVRAHHVTRHKTPSTIFYRLLLN
jgi:hypothetical protein